MKSRHSGFSLIELLTVIAIISILASIIFPIMGATRRNMQEKQCMTNMYHIYTAIKMFEQDQHRYPWFMAGPVEFKYPSGRIVYHPMSPSPDNTDPQPNADNESTMEMPKLVPLSECSGKVGSQLVALYPEYIRSLNSLRCPSERFSGSNKVFEVTDVAVDPMFQVYQDLGIENVCRWDSRMDYMTSPTYPDPMPYFVYCASTYDYQISPRKTTPESHYSTVWSADPAGSAGVDRQLRWRHPPDDTVVTWCSFHRDTNGDGTVTQSSFDNVLFLDGRVKRVNSTGLDIWTQAWKVPAPR